MNRAASTILIFMVALFFSGCASTGTAGWQRAGYTGQLETFRFAVYGMSCDTCAGKASRKLRELPGVVRAGVDFDSKQATVDAKQRTVILGDIRSALGFEALPPDERPVPSLSDDEKMLLDIRSVTHGERSIFASIWLPERSPSLTTTPTGAGHATC